MFKKPGLKLLIGAASLTLALVAWIGAALAHFLFDPTLVQWTLIVTAVAVVTDVAIWVGAAVLGISALQRIRSWIWPGRSR